MARRKEQRGMGVRKACHNVIGNIFLEKVRTWKKMTDIWFLLSNSIFLFVCFLNGGKAKGSSGKCAHVFYFYKYIKGTLTWVIGCTELYVMKIHSKTETSRFSQELKLHIHVKRDLVNDLRILLSTWGWSVISRNNSLL